MLLWVSLLVLAPVSGQFATEPKSVIFLHSPWTTVFQGENVTLTCKAFHLDASEKIKWYRWYLLEKTQSETSGNTHEVHESGDYRCQAQDSPLSNRVGLLFSPANLILQSPLDVFEKESVILRCRAKANTVLKTIKLYKNGKVLEDHTVEIPVGMLTDFHIHQASLKDNGKYHCTGVKEDNELVSSNSVKIEVQELFPRPVLRASSTQPTEGGAVTLTCETQLSPQRPDVQLQFHFFRDRRSLGSGWRSSPEFWIHTIWRENSGSYWCQAQSMNPSVQKQSQRLQIQVKIPVSHPVLTLRAPRAQAVVGDVMELHCEAWRGSPPILYRFYHEDVSLESCSSPSERGGSCNLLLTAEHSGNYFCEADNGQGFQRSNTVSLTVRVPVSQPVLTLSAPRAQAVVGDMMELHCEAWRGSPPILYRFYHEDISLESCSSPSGMGGSCNLLLTAEHSGNYFCEANNGQGAQRSNTVSLTVRVPVSQPVLTLSAPRAQAVVGDMMELHCEAWRGSPPILYRFYHEDVSLESCSSPSGMGASCNLLLTAEHSGNYFCEADNGQGAQRSNTVLLTVRVPVSQPVLTLRAPRAQAVVGDMVELHCEAQGGSPPILYQFYHKDVAVGNRSAPLGGGASFNLSLTTKHSGNYSCKADNGLGVQQSEMMLLSVIVPVSRPILTLRAPRAQAVVGDVVELHCEAQRGSPPILYQFYHKNVTLESSMSHSGQGVSLNLSLTANHSGTYSCEADNGLGPQCSEAVTLSITGRKPTFDSSRNPSASDPQEPTYHNVPSWIELQPVYSNVNPNRGDVVYSDVRTVKVENKQAAASDPELLKNTDSCVIYSQVKGAYTAAPKPQLLAASTPHR
ncbi:Fc receptor-like protein 5 isoform X2 [Phocoena sinus]|uniref:Fc receptor-like protein 5 isoform X2 n=1 Tax=Phocoena sinus TaxID=42100 RepID=UPI0013C3F952|nr:Fc receptor-like protein 5 isoform X2 [Phocoena sinus]